MSKSGENIAESSAFNAHDIRDAMNKIEPTVGKSLIESLVHGLKTIYGISLEYGNNSGSLYSIARIRQALEDMLGQEASNLIMIRVKQELFYQIHPEEERKKQQ